MGNKYRYTFYLRIVKGILLSPLALLFPRNNRKMVFGAWGGENFSDNPKYFMKFMLSVPGWNCIWIGQERLRSQVCSIKGVRFVRKGSLLALWHCLTAKYFVNNVIWMDDIMAVPSCGRIIQINLWHGTALKRIGRRQYNGHGDVVLVPDNRSSLRKLIGNAIVKIYNYLYPMSAYGVSGSENNAHVLVQSWPQIFSPDRLACAGQPRCDYLIQNGSNLNHIREVKQKLAKLIGAPLDKKWYLYLPTWRHGARQFFSFATSSKKRTYESILNDANAVIIEKQHPKVLSENPSLGASINPFYVITAEQARALDVQELLIVSDRLITDYSSCYFDFELLHRPIVHFDYDYDDYINSDSGVEYDPITVAGGAVVRTEEELCERLNQPDRLLLDAKGVYADSLVNCETGESCAALFELLPK